MLIKAGRIMVALILTVGLLYQLYGTVQYLNGRFQNKLLANRRLDAFARSADGSYGSDFAAYISFLRSSIPNRATVLIPSHQTSPFFLSDYFLMQYFLFPRNVTACQSDCPAKFADPATYIIAEGNFPAPGFIPRSKQYLRYADTVGLYAPAK
jgi:hypothetical protein